MTEESARHTQSNKAQASSAFHEWLSRLQTELSENERLSLDANASPDQLQQRVDRASDLLVEVLPWVDSSHAQLLTHDQLTVLTDSATRLRHSTERLAAEQKQAAAARDLIAQTYRLLDLLNHTVDGSQSSFPLSLAPAIDELETLKVGLGFDRFI
jgi:hypothetical protein